MREEQLRHGGSASARVSRSRPFYSSWAHVYDLLVDDPVRPWVETVHAAVSAVGSVAASVLDAGCGTGRHAAALIELGHRVTLLDASPQLLAIASSRCPGAPVRHEDLTGVRPPPLYDAVACRGVLNDLTTDEERQDALAAMSASVRSGGVVVLDVREAAGSAARATGVPRTRTVDASSHLPAVPPGTVLTFTSTATWRNGIVEVHEEHRLGSGAEELVATSSFRMRPWTEQELRTRLRLAGLRSVDIRPAAGARGADRLVVVARTETAASGQARRPCSGLENS